jgi:hypothetical protein
MRIWIVLFFYFTIANVSLAGSSPRVSYTVISDAAKKEGQLNRYDKDSSITHHIELAGNMLSFSIPQKAYAYEVIPVRYKLKRSENLPRIAVEAVAFEDINKSDMTPLYDLAIPGNIKIKIDYLGSIGADYDSNQYIPLTADPNTPISPFPPYKRYEFVRSSVIRKADIIWFKFSITNVGDTILDPEGFSATFAEPYIFKLDRDGTQQWRAQPVNLFIRHLDYIYPGESVEQWVNFYCPQLENKTRGLQPGDYKIVYRMICRFYDKYDWGVNIWAGTEFARMELPISVTENGGSSPVKTSFSMTDIGDKMPGYFSKFEEFMTSFKIYDAGEQKNSESDTIYLQVAPWSRYVVVKLITANPKEIAVAKIPIRIEDDTLRIKYNPDNVMVIDVNGTEQPVVIVQAMPAMRAGFQLSPFPEKNMYDFLLEMKNLGVNVISNTAGDWWIPEIGGRKEVEMHSACYKYFYDVLVRKLNMKVLGWSVYPPSATQWYDNAQFLIGKKLDYNLADGGYQVSSNTKSVDMGDPDVVAEMISAWILYQHSRWGDTWYKTRDGRIPIEIEDTWGWLRDDINVRYIVGPLGVEKFIKWVKEKYVTIEKVNEKWGSNYRDFSEISPQKGQGPEKILPGVEQPFPFYNNKKHIFHDWSPAIEDWDTFRTVLRLDIIKKVNNIICKKIPGAELVPRTEGANLPIKADGKSTDMHWRHVYYSQRRNAFVYDVIKNTSIIHFYSDYITLPYTNQEWRQAMREMVQNNIIPMFLPQFDHMRDILLNPYYGREYQMNYNLEKPSKGVMVHCLAAAYPWWKAAYEEGGAAGIIWSDYLCDGFATETTKKELKLLRDNFSKMKK